MTERRCPQRGGTLGAPVTEGVHCFVACARCGRRFQFDDPAILRSDVEQEPLPC
ncbi:MAG TPA: hypothetical protein VMG14_00215 [Thermoplasmata archaeon]|nr:hypothetical protein [Thermoplasmata archaeon]